MLHELLCFLLTALGTLLLLRAWFWRQAASPSSSFVRLVWRLTDWFAGPVSAVVRPRGNWDWPSLFAAFVTALVQVGVSHWFTGYPAAAASAAVAPFAMVLRWGLDMVMWLIIIGCIGSWLRSPYMRDFEYLTEPFLRPVRRVVPLIAGRFDLSPMIVVLAILIALRWVVPLSMGYFVF